MWGSRQRGQNCMESWPTPRLPGRGCAAACGLLGVTGADGKVTETLSVTFGRITTELARQLPAAQGPLTDAVRGMFRKRFDSRGAYGGGAWEPLSAATMRKRDRAGLGDAPLERYGTLDASFTQEGATGLTVRLNASSRAFGYSVLDAAGLHVGSNDPVLNLTERGTRNMPARPVLPDEVPEADAERWAQIIADSLLSSLE